MSLLCAQRLMQQASTIVRLHDGPASIDQQVGRLSGGWRMKLALARAMLLKADILMLVSGRVSCLRVCSVPACESLATIL